MMRDETIQGLRALADFLAEHPDVPLPSLTLNAFVDTKAEIAAIARVAPWGKNHNGDWFFLTRSFAGTVRLDINVPRGQVCERVVIGQRTVPAHEEDIVEWKCDESLLADAAEGG